MQLLDPSICTVSYAQLLTVDPFHFVTCMLQQGGNKLASRILTMQGVADDGTPSRDLGDTYSVSTDPSGDEGDTKAINTYEDNSIAADAIGSQSGHAELMAKGDSGALSSQPSQAPESREGAGAAASGTQETQNDPAEDAAMQEGELPIRTCIVSSKVTAHQASCECNDMAVYIDYHGNACAFFKLQRASPSAAHWQTC